MVVRNKVDKSTCYLSTFPCDPARCNINKGSRTDQHTHNAIPHMGRCNADLGRPYNIQQVIVSAINTV